MLLGTKARKFPGTASLGSVTEVSHVAEPRASEQAQDHWGVHLLHYASCWAKTTFSLFLHGANGFQGKTPSKASTQHGKSLENTPNRPNPRCHRKCGAVSNMSPSPAAPFLFADSHPHHHCAAALCHARHPLAGEDKCVVLSPQWMHPWLYKSVCCKGHQWHVLFSTLPADTLQAFQFAHYQFTVGSSQHSLLIELGLTPPGAGWPITQLYPCSRNFYKRQSLQKLVSLSGSSNFECFLNQKHQTLSALCELEASSAEFLKPADKAMQDTLPGTEALKLQTVQKWLVFSSLSEGLNMSKSSTS